MIAALAVFSSAASAASHSLIFIVDELNSKTRELAEATVTSITQQSGFSPATEFVLLDELNTLPTELSDTQTIVALGSKALELSLDRVKDGRIIAALVPYESAIRLIGSPSPDLDVSIIAAEQPPMRVAQLTEEVLPGRNSISVFHSGASQHRVEHLNSAFSASDIELTRIWIPESGDFLALMATQLPEIDALLAVPDPKGVNHTTARTVLRRMYQQKAPVIGYSREYVKAGALAAIYSTPMQLARQVAEIFVEQRSLIPGGMRLVVRPKYFEVDINQRIANSLGFELPGKDVIRKRVRDRSR